MLFCCYIVFSVYYHYNAAFYCIFLGCVFSSQSNCFLENGSENVSTDVFSKNTSVCMNFHTDNLEPMMKKVLKCDYCGQIFLNFSSLRQHVLIHTGEKPFECNICHRSFNRSGNLTVHMRQHTGERPYKCSYCDYKASKSSTLTKHVRRKH